MLRPRDARVSGAAVRQPPGRPGAQAADHPAAAAIMNRAGASAPAPSRPRSARAPSRQAEQQPTGSAPEHGPDHLAAISNGINLAKPTARIHSNSWKQKGPGNRPVPLFHSRLLTIEKTTRSEEHT